ncbi:MAG: hypothetical protein U0Q16_27800 [Bryobacteraceae bacterium]
MKGFEFDIVGARDLNDEELLSAPDVEDNMLALLTRSADQELVISKALVKIARMKGRRRDDAGSDEQHGDWSAVAGQVRRRGETG